MKNEIEALFTNNDVWYIAVPKETEEKANSPDECLIKHLGKQIYQVKYFDPYKGGGYSSLAHKQNRVNSKIILFPNDIKRIIFK